MVANLSLAEGGPTVDTFAVLATNRATELIPTRRIRAPLALKMGTFAELSGTSYELAATLRAASREPASSRGIGVSQAIRCLKVHFSCCFVERVAFVLPLLL